MRIKAGIGDQNIYAPESLDRFSHHVLVGGFIGDVADDVDSFSPGLANDVNDSFTRYDIGDHDLSALFREPLAIGRANALGPTGDNGHFVVQSCHGFFPCLL